MCIGLTSEVLILQCNALGTDHAVLVLPQSPVLYIKMNMVLQNIFYIT